MRTADVDSSLRHLWPGLRVPSTGSRAALLPQSWGATRSPGGPVDSISMAFVLLHNECDKPQDGSLTVACAGKIFLASCMR